MKRASSSKSVRGTQRTVASHRNFKIGSDGVRPLRRNRADRASSKRSKRRLPARLARSPTQKPPRPPNG